MIEVPLYRCHRRGAGSSARRCMPGAGCVVWDTFCLEQKDENVSNDKIHVSLSTRSTERLVIDCRTTSTSTAPGTPRRTCCFHAYVLITVLRVSRSCELFSDGFDLHPLNLGFMESVGRCEPELVCVQPLDCNTFSQCKVEGLGVRESAGWCEPEQGCMWAFFWPLESITHARPFVGLFQVRYWHRFSTQ